MRCGLQAANLVAARGFNFATTNVLAFALAAAPLH